MRRLLLIGLALLCTAGSITVIGEDAGIVSGGGSARTSQNVVLITLDDWGIDQDSTYYASTGAITPNINALVATSVRYTNLLAMPTCSPTRASLLTGTYPVTHGVGAAITTSDPDQDDGLASGATTFVSTLRDNGYNTYHIGKWHVAGATQIDAPATQAHSLGFTYFEGPVGIQPTSYTSYTWFEDDDSSSTKTDYITTYTTDRALAKIPGGGSYFMWVSYNAPHFPFNCPADGLTPTYDGSCTPIGGETANQAKMHAALEVADVEVARLIAGLDLTNTTVLLMGDNGTDVLALQGYDATRVKATAYLGGTKVPLYAFGAGVTETGPDASILDVTDISKTILDTVGISALSGAGISFKGTFTGTASTRQVSYAETFVPTGVGSPHTTWLRGASDAQYHLVRLSDGSYEMYDWTSTPFEADADKLNLAALNAGQTAAYNKLRAKITNP